MTELAILDVRPILAAQGDVFTTVMAAAEDIGPGRGLRLIAPFRPAPLIRLLEARGFTSTEGPGPDGAFQFDFNCPAPGARPLLAQGSTVDAVMWPEPSRSLDLSMLADDEAEARVFAALDTTAPGEVLFAVTAAEPPALLSRLDDAGHRWAGNWASDLSGFRLLIRRAAAG